MKLLQLLLAKAYAYEPKTLDVFSVEPGADISLGQIAGNVINMLGSTIAYVSSAVFVYGALLYISSALREENKNNGKQYMIGAIIGLCIVFGARGIFNLVIAFIYTPT